MVSCLAQALGNTVGLASPDENARNIERTAAEILRHYERANRAVGRERDAVVRLLRIREAIEAKSRGRPEVALDVRLAHHLMICSPSFNRSWNRPTSFR